MLILTQGQDLLDSWREHEGFLSPEYSSSRSIQINNASSATDTAGQTFPSRWLSLSNYPPSTASSCNRLVLIKVQSNHLMVPVSVDCCINMFFKNWNYYLLFSDVEYIFDRGRGCLFSMQRGSIMKCICRTVWQNIKQGKRDVCMNLSPPSLSAQQPQGRRLESSGSLISRHRDGNEWQRSI